jgi:spore coat polysaccharide biosynthesis protein SpsF
MICIIQARVNSQRLKNKMLKKINKEMIIEWVIKRCKKIKNVNKVVLAIPKKKNQKKLISIGRKLECDIYQGSENNLIKRYHEVLKKYKENFFLRVCADNPFICPEEINHLIKFFKSKKLDYAYNHAPINNSYPDGIGAEISNYNTIQKIMLNAKTKDQKEHVFNYLWQNFGKFRISTIEPKNKFLSKPFLKLDIDYFYQYEVFKKLKINSSMSTSEIIKKIIKSG